MEYHIDSEKCKSGAPDLEKRLKRMFPFEDETKECENKSVPSTPHQIHNESPSAFTSIRSLSPKSIIAREPFNYPDDENFKMGAASQPKGRWKKVLARINSSSQTQLIKSENIHQGSLVKNTEQKVETTFQETELVENISEENLVLKQQVEHLKQEIEMNIDTDKKREIQANLNKELQIEADIKENLYRQNLEELREKKGLLVAQLKEVTDEKNICLEKIIQRDEELIVKTKALQAMQENNKSKEKELSEIKHTIELLRKQADQIQSDSKQNGRKFEDEKMATLELKLSRIQAELDQITIERNNFSVENDAMKALKLETETELKTLRDEKRGLQKDLIGLKSEKFEMCRIKDKMRRALELKLESMQTQWKKLCDVNDQNHHQMKAFKVKTDTELTMLREEKKSLEDANNQLKEKIDQNGSTIDSLNIDLVGLRLDLVVSKEENKKENGVRNDKPVEEKKADDTHRKQVNKSAALSRLLPHNEPGIVEKKTLLHRSPKTLTKNSPVSSGLPKEQVVDVKSQKEKIVESNSKGPCNLCGKRFIDNYKFNRHMTTHTGGKAFSCEHCGKCFSRKDKLKGHQNLHL